MRLIGALISIVLITRLARRLHQNQLNKKLSKTPEPYRENDRNLYIDISTLDQKVLNILLRTVCQQHSNK